jgi:hypothetical protein
MPRIRSLLISLAACALVAGSAGAAEALASQSQTTYFEASALLLAPSTRHHAIEQLQHLGVKALRVELKWYEVAPDANSATQPSFEAANPDSGYDWGAYATLLAEVKQLGWPVLLTVAGPAPRWATVNHQAPYITRPEPEAFERFMTAVAREFGSEVSTYAIWNEPNEPVFLMPQWNTNGTPASPRIYRSLYQHGYAGLLAAGLSHPHVLFGETAPFGYDSVSTRKEGAAVALHHPVAPLAFLREALCLNAKYKKASSCSELPMSGFAHHAYTLPAGPYYTPPQRDDVTIGALSRLSSALSQAAHAHAIPADTPIYLTEFGVQTFPNKELGVTGAQQAQFDAIDEHIAYDNPHVVAFSQYLLKDDALGGSEPGASFQTGLEYYNGTAKPLYYGWPIPLTVTKHGGGVSLWGLVRPTTGATKVTILVKAKGAKRYKTLRTVTTNSRGYWSFNSSTSGQDWRVLWTSPKGVKYEGPAIGAYSAG